MNSCDFIVGIDQERQRTGMVFFIYVAQMFLNACFACITMCLSWISQIMKWAWALGEAWLREVHGRRACAHGCAVVKDRGASQVWVLRLGVWGWMGSLGELEDERWYGGTA